MVSHCWSSPYTQLMAILKRHDENTNKNNFFWIDIFSMNQHDFADLSGVHPSDGVQRTASVYDTMLQALTRSIEVPGRMLLALLPHQHPALLSRAWCLYEIYIAWKVGAEVYCGFVPDAERSVKRSLLEDETLIQEVLDSVDAEKSQATVQSDREMIMDFISAAGVERFNAFVREQLEASLRMVAVTTLLNVSVGDEVESDPCSPCSPSSDLTRSQFVHADIAFHSEEEVFST